MLLKIILNGKIQRLSPLGAEVTDGAIDQLQSSLNRALAYLLDLIGIAEPLDVLVSSEFKVYPIFLTSPKSRREPTRSRLPKWT